MTHGAMGQSKLGGVLSCGSLPESSAGTGAESQGSDPRRRRVIGLRLRGLPPASLTANPAVAAALHVKKHGGSYSRTG